jgi:hypothetical protein
MYDTTGATQPSYNAATGFYTPCDGQPCSQTACAIKWGQPACPTGTAWTYGANAATAGSRYELNVYLVGGAAETATAVYVSNGGKQEKFAPGATGLLAMNYGCPNTARQSNAPVETPTGAPNGATPSSLPTVSNSGRPSGAPHTANPVIDLDSVTLQPSVSAEVISNQAQLAKAISSSIGVAFGVFSIIAVVLAALFFRNQIKDTLFGPRKGIAQLIEESDGKFELGSLDQNDDASAWIQMETPDGRPYWYNIDTCLNSYEKPAALIQPIGEAAAWSTHYTDDGRPYYYNANTGTSTYEKPACLKV